MRIRGKTDRNHAEIVRALRQAGATVESLADLGGGCPDLLVGYGGYNFLMEVKDGMATPSAQKLNDRERTWHVQWRGTVHTVRSAVEALELLKICVY